MIEVVDTHQPARIVPRWLWLLGLLFASLTIAQSVGVCFMGSGWTAPRGTLGINELAGCESDRFCAVTLARPDSPAGRAGIVPGDRLRLDRYWERHRTMAPGDRIGVTVRHGVQERHVILVADPRPFYAPTWIADGLASAAVCLIALVIIARAGGRWWSFLLGCALVGIGIPGGYPRFWQNEPSLYPWFFAGLAVAYMAGPVMMLAALRGFRRDIIGHVPAWLDRLLLTVASIVLLATIWGTAVELESAPIFGLSNGLLLTSLTWSLASLMGPVALAAGWREVPPAGRTRYAFMWAAVSVSSLHPLIDPLIIASGNNYSTTSVPVLVQLASTILGPLLFAYAILRYRVVDLGFAINRTLVYSTLSFLTLMVFGVVEWASEKLLPFESKEASAVIEAAVALSLFLVFHHVHAWLEQFIEKLFFHRWHANEAELRRFLHEAGYITREPVLIDRMLLEFRRFTGGAAAGFYRATAAGYELAAGDADRPTIVDRDSPALVSMRANRAVVRDGFAPGDILLPMMHRAEVTGFVVLGSKPDGGIYRTDEERALADAVGRIGLDLYALLVDELQEANTRLLAEVEGFGARRRRPRALA